MPHNIPEGEFQIPSSPFDVNWAPTPIAKKKLSPAYCLYSGTDGHQSFSEWYQEWRVGLSPDLPDNYLEGTWVYWIPTISSYCYKKSIPGGFVYHKAVWPPAEVPTGVQTAQTPYHAAPLGDTLTFALNHPVSTNEDEEPPEQIELPQKEDLTEMKISTTKLQDVIKNYAPLPTPLSCVEGCYESLVNLLTSNSRVPEKLLRIPELNKRSHDVLVGIEIEVEKHNWNPVAKELGTENIIKRLKTIYDPVWISKQDNSLKDSGMEYITRVGLQAKDVPKALRILDLLLRSFYQSRQLNYRCGTHVHVNVRDLTIEHFINMAVLYVVFENMFYRVSGDRYKNIFCVPIRASTSEIESLFRLVHNPKPTFQQFRSIFNKFKKYMAYNLLPAGKDVNGHHGNILGTVEFRHHEGESDPFKLCKWIQYILDIHYTAQQYSFTELIDVIFNLNTVSNYIKFASSVFTQLPNEQEMTTQELVNDMYEGSAFVKEFYLRSKESD